jgi:hypothetical protein
MFTSDMPWNPSVLDNQYNTDDIRLSEDDHIADFGHHQVDPYGELVHLESSNLNIKPNVENFPILIYDDYIDNIILNIHLNKVTPLPHVFYK